MEEPPVQLFMRGTNRWFYELEWPLPKIQPTQLYLRSFGGLSADPETHMEEPDCYFQQPLHVSYEIQSLTYTTSRLPEDLEVIGPISLNFFASIDQDDTNWIVRLYDIDDHNTTELVSLGYLKASHRELDKTKSTPSRPYHAHLRPAPVVPGEVNEYAVALSPVANAFKAGHRIMLEIRSMEHWREPEGVQSPFSIHLCSGKPTLHRIFRDDKHRSCLLLPLRSLSAVAAPRS